jgi:hypothetical protein
VMDCDELAVLLFFFFFLWESLLEDPEEDGMVILSPIL